MSSKRAGGQAGRQAGKQRMHALRVAVQHPRTSVPDAASKCCMQLQLVQHAASVISSDRLGDATKQQPHATATCRAAALQHLHILP
jgi:hypothetical protein